MRGQGALGEWASVGGAAASRLDINLRVFSGSGVGAILVRPRHSKIRE